ncbi:hypothetical protein SAMN04487897_111109 [Paenibacillus sp. yr247]|uniref:hypothetical protein n=1 Tax=Paenibacillus sp. yr247 TaxID=1761880 RepID=UPI00088F325A|nr:hypothetical protein [Paenibacillus sp. yr247]SDO29863.1 hypothetical protein SAMN04487897_111109 [Paenibacillus sp. yr247]
MNMLLAIIGGLLGLFVTGAAIYTAWMIHQLWRQQAAAPKAASQVEIAVKYFSRWTIIDYAVVGLFIIGLILLLAELFAILRDQTALASFHFSYLLTGIIISAMGMLLLFVRLVVVLGFIKSGVLHRTVTVAPNHQNEPDNTDQAK